jgi:xanthine dehydrogenase YagS FAD-binding subunit
MRPFEFSRADTVQAAINEQVISDTRTDGASVHAPNQYVAGGTTLIDLMKLDVMRPQSVTDINALEHTPSGEINFGPHGLHLGALVRMSAAASHPDVLKNYPVIAQALALAASPQIRNMASLGGNVLQRTRCTYFRDTSYSACNKREPGSGCAALQGINRSHAVLGVSDHCIATYPGDFAQALIALDAEIEIVGPKGSRTLPFAKLHRLPGDAPHVETTLAPGELILAFMIPSAPWTRRSLFLKIRDRQSYEFALASAAVALDLDGGTVRQTRIALGGVSATPWRSHAAEQKLRGRKIDDATLHEAAEAAFEQAKPREHNAFKIQLGKLTLMRAMRQAATMELQYD